MDLETARRWYLLVPDLGRVWCKAGVCHIGFSDHCLIYAIRKFSAPKGAAKVVLCRSFTKFDSVDFRNDLSTASWKEIKKQKDPNVAWDLWNQMFLPVADKHAPLKKKRVRGLKCLWITNTLKKQMFERDRPQVAQAFGLCWFTIECRGTFEQSIFCTKI